MTAAIRAMPGGQKKIKIAPLHRRPVSVRFRRDSDRWCARYGGRPRCRASVRRLRCDRDGRHGKRLSIKTAAAGAGSDRDCGLLRFRRTGRGQQRDRRRDGRIRVRRRCLFGRRRAARSREDGISGGERGFAVTEEAGFCAGSTGAEDGSADGRWRSGGQAGSTARLPVSARGRAARPGSAATGTGVPAGSARSWRAGPNGRGRGGGRRSWRRFACDGAGSGGVTRRNRRDRRPRRS